MSRYPYVGSMCSVRESLTSSLSSDFIVSIQFCVVHPRAMVLPVVGRDSEHCPTVNWTTMTTMITTSRLTTSTLHQFLATRRNTTTMMLLWPRRPNLNTPPNFGIYWPYHQAAASSNRAASLNWDHHRSRPTVAATATAVPFTLRPNRHESQSRLATVTRSALSRHSTGTDTSL
jgi:hypothetical protein